MTQTAISGILIGPYGLHAFGCCGACALSWVSLGIQFHDVLLRTARGHIEVA